MFPNSTTRKMKVVANQKAEIFKEDESLKEILLIGLVKSKEEQENTRI